MMQVSYLSSEVPPPQLDLARRYGELVLFLIPTCLFLAFTPFHIARIFMESRSEPHARFYWSRLIPSLSLVLLELANLFIIPSMYPELKPNTIFEAEGIAVLASIALITILLWELVRSTSASAIVRLYLSVSLLGDLFTVPFYPKINDTELWILPPTLSAVLKCIFLAVEIITDYQVVDGASVSVIQAVKRLWTLTVCPWINTTFLIGFRTVKTIDDLPALGPSFESARLSADFETEWAKARNYGQYRLIVALFQTTKWSFITAIFPQFLYTALLYAQALLILHVVRASGQQDLDSAIIIESTFITAVVFLGVCLSFNTHQQCINRQFTLWRGCITSAIYGKILKLDQATLKENPGLMNISGDTMQLEGGLIGVHHVWITPFEIPIAIYLLSWFVGKVAFLLLPPLSVSLITTFVISSKIAAAEDEQLEIIERRIAATSDMLRQMRSIKMSGLIGYFAKSIQRMLGMQLQISARSKYLIILLYGLDMAIDFITPTSILSGAIFLTTSKTGLAVADAFTILSLVALGADRTGFLFPSISRVISVLAFLRRVQNYLLLKELADIRDEPAILPPRTFNIMPILKNQNNSRPSQRANKQTSQSSKKHNTIQIHRASTTPVQHGRQILNNISIVFLPEQLTIIIGTTGCGKSTLLKLIIGELKTIEGTIFVDKSSIAYCDERPWLRSTTIRENIVGENAFVLGWYETVLEACNLIIDIEALRDGDRTLVGTEGLNLSGGQKQRVALARAIYARSTILILDDIFSNIDKKTADDILVRLFGSNGLLRRAKVTVIMATNRSEYVPFADQLLQLDKNGQLTTLNKMVYMVKNTPTFYQFDPRNPPILWFTPGDKISITGNVPSLVKTIDIEHDIDRQRGTFSLFLFYIKSFGLLKFFVFISFVFATATLEKGMIIIIRFELVRSKWALVVSLAGLGFATVAGLVGMLYFYMVHGVTGSTKSLHQNLLNVIIGGRLGFLSRLDHGWFLDLFQENTSIVGEMLPVALWKATFFPITLAIDTIIIASSVQNVSLFTSIFIAFYCFIFFCYLKAYRRAEIFNLRSRGRALTHYTETATGIQHIRALNWQAAYKIRAMDVLDCSQRSIGHMSYLKIWLRLIFSLGTVLSATVVVNMSLRHRCTKSDVAVGAALLQLMNYGLVCLNPVSVAVALDTRLQAVARIRSMAKLTPKSHNTVLTVVEEEILMAGWRNEGRIEFRNVTAKYSENDRQTLRVLEKVTFECEPRQSIGVSGRTGSGKTSLLLTICNLLPYTGSILIDGVELRTIPDEILYERITVIPQDPIEIPGSIRLNLCPFYSNLNTSESDRIGRIPQERETVITDRAITQILDHLGIWAHLEKHGGLDADMIALKLSQGQKQLINIARGVMHHIYTGSKIVLIDEITSNLDYDTIQRVYPIIADIFADCTLVAVDHREDMMKTMDLVLNIEGGRLDMPTASASTSTNNSSS